MTTAIRISACLAAVLCSASTLAQTLYRMDDGAPGVSPVVYETAGPPGSSCGRPNGRLVVSFPTDAPGPSCPFPIHEDLGFSHTGDVTVDRASDTVWAGSDLRLAEYRPDGSRLDGLVVPSQLLPLGVLSGLGFDSGSGDLLLAGSIYVAHVVPLPGCDAGVASQWLGNLGFITDVSLDPSSDTLWLCTVGGEIYNVERDTGDVLQGPIQPMGAGLEPPLLGIAVDTATPNSSSSAVKLYVTDGTTIAYLIGPSGIPADATFYTPQHAWPAPADVNGLGFAAHDVTFGAPSGAAISMAGQSVQGGSFQVELTGATPGSDVYLLVDTNLTGTGPLCPPPTIGAPAATVHVDPSPFGPILLGSLGGASTLTLPLSLDPADPPGLTFFMQLVVDTTPGVSGGPYETTEGLAWTICRP